MPSGRGDSFGPGASGRNREVEAGVMSRMVLITPRVAVQLAGSPRLPELPAARLSGPDSVAGCGEKTPYISPSPPSEEAGAGGAGQREVRIRYLCWR